MSPDRRTPSAILDAALTNARRGPARRQRDNAIVRSILTAREFNSQDAAEHELERVQTNEGRF